MKKLITITAFLAVAALSCKKEKELSPSDQTKEMLQGEWERVQTIQIIDGVEDTPSNVSGIKLLLDGSEYTRSNSEANSSFSGTFDISIEGENKFLILNGTIPPKWEILELTKSKLKVKWEEVMPSNAPKHENIDTYTRIK